MIKSANIMPVRTDECIAMCCENTDHINADTSLHAVCGLPESF